MCLNIELLNLKYSNHHKEYIGTGYKSYHTNENNTVDMYCGTNIRVGVWLDAVKLQGKPGNKLKDEIASNYPRSTYAAGFHILLTDTDAKNYRRYGSYDVYEVQYKTIIGFGKNHLNKNRKNANCVIARYMKIVRKVPKIG